MDFSRYLSYLDQPVLICDQLDQVVTMNPAFQELFPLVEPGESARAFLREYPAIGRLMDGGEGVWPLEHGGRLYSATISLVRRRPGGTPLARCAMLADVTDTARLVAEVAEAGAMLERYNDQAERQNREIARQIELKSEVAAMRETNRLLRDLHDTLGHSLTIVNALQRLAMNALPDRDAVLRELREALRYTNISIAEMESTGTGLLGGGLTAFFGRFRASMARAGLDVVLDICGEESEAHLYMYPDLSRICQEAATNSIRHGGATRLEVKCRFGPTEVSLRLLDNGRAPDVLNRGNGLVGMDERVNNLFGDIFVGKATNGGFEIRIDVPVIRD